MKNTTGSLKLTTIGTFTAANNSPSTRHIDATSDLFAHVDLIALYERVCEEIEAERGPYYPPME